MEGSETSGEVERSETSGEVESSGDGSEGLRITVWGSGDGGLEFPNVSATAEMEPPGCSSTRYKILLFYAIM